MKLILTTVAALLLAGCTKTDPVSGPETAEQKITGIDGRAYVRVSNPTKTPEGIPATEAIYQVAGNLGSGKPAYIRSLGSRDSFTRVGDLP